MPLHQPRPLRSASEFRVGRTAIAVVAAVVALIALLTSGGIARADVPEGFVVSNAFPGVTFNLPVRVTFLPDGRALVAEKAGRVHVIEDGIKLGTLFIDLVDEAEGTGDLGLTGMALDPDFVLNRWIYFAYTVDPEPGVPNDDYFSRVMRVQADATDPNVADLSTRQVLLGETWPEGIPSMTPSHSVGTLRFAPDKTLLVGHGDGARFQLVDSGGLDPGGFGPGRTDPSEDLGAFRARSVDSYSGGILRIDKESGLGLPSNPYWDGNPDSHRSRVWAYGLRNPFRFSIRPGTGSTDPASGNPGVLYVGDVGWLIWEEFDIIRTAGLNGGWPCREGPVAVPGYQSVVNTEAGNDSILCDSPANLENPAPETGPVSWWHHEDPEQSSPSGHTARSITGGVFYTGTNYPEEWQGRYYIADFINNWMMAFEVDENDQILDSETFLTGSSLQGVVDFEIEPVSGDIVFISLFTGEVRRIGYFEPSAIGEEDRPEPVSFAHIDLSARPNPMHGATTLEFEQATSGPVTVRIFGAAGRVVRTLVEEGELPRGLHHIEWDGRDRRGRSVPPGLYLAHVRSSGLSGTVKVIVR